MMKKWVFVFISMALLIMTTSACSGPVESKNADNMQKLKIVTTIFPVYDFARAVTGNQAELTMLVKPGTEVHTYDPSPADIIKIQEADVFIYVGGENDAWVDTILDTMDTKNKKIIRLMDSVKPLEEEKVEGMQVEVNSENSLKTGSAQDQIEYDEHIWTSPKNAVLMIRQIATALEEIDGKNAPAYVQQADAYSVQIQEVDTEIQKIVDESAHKMIVFGDRFPFRYFTDEFGLEYKAAFNGCSSESEASAGTLAYLINFIKEQNIKYVYYIELSNQKIARTLHEETGAELLLLHSAHNVTKEDFDAGVTYLSIMKQNEENLRKGLANQ
jgi:zinc transport system substrate-binding protein